MKEKLLTEEKRVEAQIELKERRHDILHIQSPSLPHLGVPQNMALKLPQALLLRLVQLTPQHPAWIQISHDFSSCKVAQSAIATNSTAPSHVRLAFRA